MKQSQSSVCEVCGKGNKTVAVVNVGLDVGYHYGNVGKAKTKSDFSRYISPKCVAVCSISLCKDCTTKVGNMGFEYGNEYLKINVLPELKKLIKGAWLKKMVIEEMSEWK